MSPLILMSLMTTGAGACIPMGALLALVCRGKASSINPEVKHFVIAFGGGILIAAVSLVLLPRGIQTVKVPVAAVAMLGQCLVGD